MSTLARLVHFRWAVPVLAELHRGHGGRFVNLTHTLGVSRESLRRTLAFLTESGLIQRNPGKGHPLRPEYLLTDPGLGAVAAVLTDLLADLGLTDVGLKKWSLPTLTLLAGDRRFSELRRALPDVTPRALTLTLKDLESADLIRRTVTADYPPATVYRATASGLRLAQAAEQLGTPGRVACPTTTGLRSGDLPGPIAQGRDQVDAAAQRSDVCADDVDA